MNYSDVGSFAITVHQDDYWLKKRIEYNKIEDEDAADFVAHALISTACKRNKDTGVLESKIHKIIVIDEVEQ